MKPLGVFSKNKETPPPWTRARSLPLTWCIVPGAPIIAVVAVCALRAARTRFHGTRAGGGAGLGGGGAGLGRAGGAGLGRASRLNGTADYY